MNGNRAQIELAMRDSLQSKVSEQALERNLSGVLTGLDTVGKLADQIVSSLTKLSPEPSAEPRAAQGGAFQSDPTNAPASDRKA